MSCHSQVTNPNISPEEKTTSPFQVELKAESKLINLPFRFDNFMFHAALPELLRRANNISASHAASVGHPSVLSQLCYLHSHTSHTESCFNNTYWARLFQKCCPEDTFKSSASTNPEIARKKDVCLHRIHHVPHIHFSAGNPQENTGKEKERAHKAVPQRENRPRFNMRINETEEDTSLVQVSKFTYISKNIL